MRYQRQHILPKNQNYLLVELWADWLQKFCCSDEPGLAQSRRRQKANAKSGFDELLWR